MTGPSVGVPERRSVYDAPAVPPGEMTPEQQEQFSVAQVAAIVAAAGATKVTIANATTLALIPLLRTIDPFNAVEVAQFAAKAAQYVEAARQEMAKVTWAATKARLAAYDVPFTAAYEKVKPGRATKLEVAYERPAAAYRMRMAEGFKSISNLIDQVEEERFQQLGGAEAAAQRTGESNAEVEGKKRPLTEGGGKSQTAKSGTQRTAGGSDRGAAAGQGKPRPARPDPVPDAEPDDFDFTADLDAEEARQAELDAEFDLEQELRDQARLSEDEKRELLKQQAQQDMEIRTERMINDDVAMAKRDAHQAAIAKTPARVTGYRRVVHPELAESGMSCGLCIVASTRIYKKTELMPIHNLCNCEQVEIIDGKDPGDQINKEDLDAMYADAGFTTDGRDLKEQDYYVFDHPELGPILRNKEHSKRAIKFSTREASSAHKERSKAERKAIQEKKAEKFGR